MEQTMRPQESENLGQMVVAYKNQIKDIESILPFTTGEQRVELESLLRSMYEFIQLSDNHDADEKSPNRHKESKSAAPSASVSPSVSSIDSDELKKIAEQWEGKNCRAPFQQLSGSVSYHNAVVVHIEPNLDPEGDILVQVAFSNPTTAKMRPCSFYMNGTCRFSDMKCRYSHGQIVKLSSLKEYVEPDFRLIRVETRVLAKSPKDELWYPGVVSNELENHIFTIALDDSLTSLELPLQFLLPIENDVDEPDADTDDNTAVVGTEHQLGTLVQVGWSYATAHSDLPLGEWEKHTKGIGSKLMANMGYRIGQGLGKAGQGRLNPVDAVVLPAGRSLDHCMELKEQAMDQDLLKVEKRLERAKAKEERRLHQMSERAPEKPSSSIFDFMNSTLATVNPKPSTSAEPTKSKNIKSLSTERLNLQGFQLAETIRKTEKDLAQLRTSLQRQQNRGDTQLVQQTREKIENKQRELSKLKAKENSVSKEQDVRKNSRKLSIF